MPIKTISLPSLPPFEIDVHDASDQYLSRFILETGIYEPIETISILRLLANNVDFVDLGANVGWYTLIAGTALRGRGRVHSFEPDPDNFTKLSANVARNALHNVAIYKWAISDRIGSGLLYRAQDNLGDHQLYDNGAGRTAVTVDVRTLDSYPEISRERPVIVKMDTQGSELRILRGMNELLTTHPHELVIVSEYCPKMLVDNRSSPKEMIDLLRSAGFSILLIDRIRRMLQPVTWNFIEECTAGIIAPATENFFDLILYRKPDGIIRSLFNG